MNKITPKKLLHSKWTAVNPINKERHFLITEVKFNEDQTVESCLIEAVMTKRLASIDWNELKDVEKWLQGWK